MTDLEVEIPRYHPKGCDCVLCLSLEDLFAERDALRARVEFLLKERILIEKTHRADIALNNAKIATLRARIVELESRA